MALTITDTEITSDITDVRAEYRPHAAADGGWVICGPGRGEDGQPARLYTKDMALLVIQTAELAESGGQ